MQGKEESKFKSIPHLHSSPFDCQDPQFYLGILNKIRCENLTIKQNYFDN